MAVQFGLFDHLSDGRLEVGVGRGISPLELGYFGVTQTHALRSIALFAEHVMPALAD